MKPTNISEVRKLIHTNLNELETKYNKATTATEEHGALGGISALNNLLKEIQ